MNASVPSQDPGGEPAAIAPANRGSETMTPQEIVHELDKFIVGQAEAKRAVAIALRNRWRRAQVADPLRTEITPKNILMIGPTGVILVAELNTKSRSAGDTASTRVGDQMNQLIALLESRDPESMMIVGGFLAQNAIASTLHVGPNGEIPEPSAFLGAFSLVACDLGPDCVQLSREPQMACAYGGYCDAASFEELYYNFMATPFTYMQAVRYRELIHTAINTHNWSLIGLTPPVAAALPPSQ